MLNPCSLFSKNADGVPTRITRRSICSCRLGMVMWNKPINTMDFIVKHITKRYEVGISHQRLFHTRSINVFHSTFSLRWISQVPESVMDKRSMAYNRGRVFIHGASEQTSDHVTITSFRINKCGML